LTSGIILQRKPSVTSKDQLYETTVSVAACRRTDLVSKGS